MAAASAKRSKKWRRRCRLWTYRDVKKTSPSWRVRVPLSLTSTFPNTPTCVASRASLPPPSYGTLCTPSLFSPLSRTREVTRAIHFRGIWSALRRRSRGEKKGEGRYSLLPETAMMLQPASCFPGSRFFLQEAIAESKEALGDDGRAPTQRRERAGARERREQDGEGSDKKSPSHCPALLASERGGNGRALE